MELLEWSSWQDVEDADWPWPNFTPKEMSCKGSGELKVNPSFMCSLQTLRDLLGPLHVTSGYRSPLYNSQVSKTGLDGPHTMGCAADIQASAGDALVLLKRAFTLNFKGYGLKQHGPHADRFVHLDTVPGVFRLWTY